MGVLWVGALQLSVNLSEGSTTKTQGASPPEGGSQLVRGAGRFAACDTEDKERWVLFLMMGGS